MKTEQIHISRIIAGDTILHNGKDTTVCKKDIKNDGFNGITIFGDSYHLGNKLVTRILYV